jgi:hypothetical protein
MLGVISGCVVLGLAVGVLIYHFRQRIRGFFQAKEKDDIGYQLR